MWTARSGGQLWCAGQLWRPHLLRMLLWHRLRSRYGSWYRRARSILRLWFAHVLLVLGGRSGRRGQLGAQVFVLPQEPGQLRFNLVEERIDLVLVIALAETDGRELLVTNVLGGQRHLFTST